MTIINRFQQAPKLATLAFSAALLTACGGGDPDPLAADNSDGSNLPDLPSNPEVCTQATGNTINLTALLEANCNNLSDYNLFSNASDPTSGPNGRGLPFKLSTPLFTDYASKYRFVFVPEGAEATYSEHEAMNFPVGTVLSKTFTLPADTANRAGDESIIETRLLINRESGWVALPYFWENKSDARLLITGTSVSAEITHNGSTISFDYGVPKASQCTACHSILTDGSQTFLPIGPKARYLNWDLDYGDGNGLTNQLEAWEAAGILAGVPDTNTIDTAAIFTDNDDPSTMTTNEVELAARSYLDINCAHCHRAELTLPSGYSGAAGGSGLNIEFNRVMADNTSKFGVCKEPLAGGLPAAPGELSSHPYAVVPGYSEVSYLPYRMNTNDSRHRMPELGRATVHTEGVALINEWIDRMPANTCGISNL
jgi:uncharacterized repeat protein (TIGR03806 family)